MIGSAIHHGAPIAASPTPRPHAAASFTTAYIVLSLFGCEQAPVYTAAPASGPAASLADRPGPATAECASLADRYAAAPADVGRLPLAAVESITDGDTLAIVGADGAQTIRLAGIDVPELRQAGGPEARAELAALAWGPMAVDVRGRDRYGRAVARLYARGLDIGRAMIARGAAWTYPMPRHATEEEARADLLA